MADGSLKLPEACKCRDGTYRKDGSTYSIMTALEYMQYKSTSPTSKSTPTGITAHTVPLQPPKAPHLTSKPAPQIPTTDIGCSAGVASKTVFVVGNVDGDAARFDLAIQQSSKLAANAARRNNTVFYAVCGNVAPDVAGNAAARLGDDVVVSALRMSKEGLQISTDHKLEAQQIILLSGERELGWLRLMAPKELREVTFPTDSDAYEVLMRHSPFVGTKEKRKLTDIQLHNASLSRFPKDLGESQMAIAMLLKLVSVAHRTMRAPGLVSGFAIRLMQKGEGDEVALSALLGFLAKYGGSIEEGMDRLMHNGDLTPEGLGILPAAGPVIETVLSYAKNTMLKYMKTSSLVVSFANHTGYSSNSAWITPLGIDISEAVGKLPCGFDSAKLAVEWEQAVDEHGNAIGVENPREWSKALNRAFRDVMTKVDKGTVSRDLYMAYVGLALNAHAYPLPLRALATSPVSTCYGFAPSKPIPFGTVKRRILVKDPSTVGKHQSDLLRVTDQWATINTEQFSPSTYWGIMTWCGGTKMDIGSVPFVPSVEGDFGHQLRAVSVTLASMVTARTRGRSLSDNGIENLKGVLGPVVYHEQKQLMRVIGFSHDSIDLTFVALLPEPFVQFSLNYYNYNLEAVAGWGAPMIATEGFLALPDEAVVPLGFEQVSEAENEAYRAELGTRLWALPRRGGGETASDADAIKAMYESKETTRSKTIPGFTILHTRQTSDDPFAGLSVGLNEVPGLRGRITIDTDMTSYHSLFRVVAKE
jgi:hypothetical protein